MVCRGSTLVGVNEAALLAYGPARVTLDGARVVGKLSADALARGVMRNDGKERETDKRVPHRVGERAPGMVDVRCGASLTAVDSQVTGFGGGGLDAYRAASVTLARCRVVRNHGAGVRVEECGTLVMSDCVVEGNRGDGVNVAGGTPFGSTTAPWTGTARSPTTRGCS